MIQLVRSFLTFEWYLVIGIVVLNIGCKGCCIIKRVACHNASLPDNIAAYKADVTARESAAISITHLINQSINQSMHA
jgi:hypothetical protein